LDVHADRVSGTIHAPWYAQPLLGRCSVWAENGIEIPFAVSPDGGAFSCHFGAQGWDLQPGQTVAVAYADPQGHEVINVFEEPTPRLSVHQRVDGQPSVGGNQVFHIQYRNEGGAPAENVVITDTMRGFTYLGDTSGLPFTTGVTPGGDPYVAWELGDLDPTDRMAEFQVFVAVAADAGDPVRNAVEITTSNPYNQSEPWQTENVWEGTVAENDARLQAHAWAWTGDPLAGGSTILQLTACNHGGTTSSQVRLTATVQPPLSLNGWWSDVPGWGEESRSGQELVVSRLALAAGECSDVYVRAAVDPAAQPGDPLWSTMEVFAANDETPDDNESHWEGVVGQARSNLRIEMSWGHGQLTPGGQANYWVHAHNDGNTAVTGSIRITDTLPVSTTLVRVEFHSPLGQEPVTLTETGTGYVVWEIDGLENGFSRQFMVTVDVDADAAPGASLVNGVEMAAQPQETSYSDNLAAWSETLNPSGPNLRVRKEGGWDDWGEGTRRASYWLNVENVGDQVIAPVVITDIFPEGMRLDGVNVQFWEDWEWHDHGDHLTITLARLEPGWLVGVDLATLFEGDSLPLGVSFENRAELTLPPGDTNPDDNHAVAVLTTGPDLFIEQALVDGEPRPGEMITFSLRFGNRLPKHEWWWTTRGNAVITQALGEGLEYVSALLHWCGTEAEWCPIDPNVQDGGRLVWDLWPLGPFPGDRPWDNEILLTARIADDVAGSDSLTSTAEIASDQPDVDLEPRYDNNLATVSVLVLPKLYRLWLPQMLH
ncbi:MAG: DUF11 domain-containing protein, partial [Chloroflexi bacterium]|nr:DUF11 domain-containing protein [Chloroflexota bacterium]